MQRRHFLFLLSTPGFVFGRKPLRERQIKLEGAQNFRDLGGYPTHSGQRIRYGRVFRSDSLAKLTPADFQKLSELRIRTVCDLRSAAERAAEKTSWPQGPQAPKIIHLDILAANSNRSSEDPTRAFLTRLLGRQAQPGAASELLAESMQTMALTAAPLYGELIRHILESRQPLLFHCTAGKDRTGLAAALLMKVLDVTEEAIFEDYLLVNQIVPVDKNAQALADRIKAFTGQEIPVETLKPLLGTQREWLSAAFSAIEQKYGSFDRYRQQAMGLSNNEVKRLKKILLD
ncbi:MAG: tyrosine-protein phosphatase [Bryobacteraceae bacterium]|nr:tyrosine-protein phosphatase [Bryobacteraceae bacterium]MDW8377826.1 tyrosine-protein phosphatase [Bryobacterales bacterium]